MTRRGSPIVVRASVDSHRVVVECSPKCLGVECRAACLRAFGLVDELNNTAIQRRGHAGLLGAANDLTVEKVHYGGSAAREIFPHRGARIGVHLHLGP